MAKLVCWPLLATARYSLTTYERCALTMRYAFTWGMQPGPGFASTSTSPSKPAGWRVYICRSWKEGRPRYQRTRGKKGGVKKLRHWIPKGDNKLLYEFLPNETSRQTHALDEAVRVLDGRVDLDGRGIVVLDLGCGDGHSFEMFSA